MPNSKPQATMRERLAEAIAKQDAARGRPLTGREKMENLAAACVEWDRDSVRNDECPMCGCGLDTGWECNDCGFDAMPIVKADPDYETTRRNKRVRN